jgi:hypothetical protein
MRDAGTAGITLMKPDKRTWMHEGTFFSCKTKSRTNFYIYTLKLIFAYTFAGNPYRIKICTRTSEEDFRKNQ